MTICKRIASAEYDHLNVATLSCVVSSSRQHTLSAATDKTLSDYQRRRVPAIQQTLWDSTALPQLSHVTADVIVVVMATACSVVMANDVYGGGMGSGSSGGFRAHTATNCILMTVSVISICALVVCGVLVVREYSLAMSYLPTDCRIGNITYARHDVTCKHCASG